MFAIDEEKVVSGVLQCVHCCSNHPAPLIKLGTCLHELESSDIWTHEEIELVEKRTANILKLALPKGVCCGYSSNVGAACRIST